MILVDTSVWIEHLRGGSQELESLLMENQVMCHDFVIGELACGNLKKRAEILRLLGSLEMAILAETNEVLNLVDKHRLYGRGLGWIDVHLIASALLSGVKLWSLDKPLTRVTDKLGLRISY